MYVRRRGAEAFLSPSLLQGLPHSCIPRVARCGVARGSGKQGLGKGGALSLVLIVQATAEEVNRGRPFTDGGERFTLYLKQSKSQQAASEQSTWIHKGRSLV